MKLSAAGILMIEGFEGCRLVAYLDKAGHWTIGIGSTRYANGLPVKNGDALKDKAAARSLLQATIKQYEDTVNRHVMVPLTQNQFDALVSFSYNEGTGALPASHLLIYLNAGKYHAAADELLKWDKITNPHTGQKEPYDVLELRRKKERLIFLKP